MSNPDFQKALRESEETYRNLFQNAQVGLFRTRISDGKILEANQQIAKMFGYPSREEFIAEYATSNNYVDAGTRDRMLREIRKNGEVQDFGARFYRKDRKIFWASYSARIFPEKGWIEGVVEDISERKKAEEALKERERQLHLIIENLPGFVYRCRYDHQWTMLYLSEGVYKATGYTPEELIGNRELSFNDLIRKDFQEIIWRDWQKAIENKTRFVAEYPILNAGGEERWIWERGRGVYDEKGEVLFLEGYIEDISEKKYAETALKKLEWMLRKGKTTDDHRHSVAKEPAYGDLTKLNTSRLILDSVGEEVLSDIARDYMGLLDTSSAIYEKNGDYALGLFSSGWCHFLDASSRKNCQTDNDQEALGCEQWLCHRSCWEDASVPAMEKGEAVDIECNGGIRLYALPIRSGNEIIGAINFGYGDPPRDTGKLSEIAEKYQVPVGMLREKAGEYETRPPFIIETARDRLAAAAKLIGEIVRRKSIEEQLRQINQELESAVHHKTQELRERVAELERFQEATIEREFRMKELREEIEILKARSGDMNE
jgi:PAS domain S-box-containing protein